MSVATFITACATCLSVREVEITRKEANSAEVIVYLKIEYNRMYIIIENIGKTIEMLKLIQSLHSNILMRNLSGVNMMY